MGNPGKALLRRGSPALMVLVLLEGPLWWITPLRFLLLEHLGEWQIKYLFCSDNASIVF